MENLNGPALRLWRSTWRVSRLLRLQLRMRVVRMVDAMPIGNTGQARRHWHTFRPCQRLSLGGGRQREMLSSFITPLGLHESEHKHVYIYARAHTHTHTHTHTHARTCRRAESETDVNNPETDVAADSSEAAMRLSPLSSSVRGPAIFCEKQTPAQPSRPAVVSDLKSQL